MSSIGMLYLATGPYKLFFERFYSSFEEKFVPELKKNYYVFTDDTDFFNQFGENVKAYKIDNLPWPLITLLRFQYFLSIEKDIKDNDYLVFTNANLSCDMLVTLDELLVDDSQQMFFCEHPGYYKRKPLHKIYDRNPKCTAFIPYHRGKKYVIGAFFGGKAEAFLKMSNELKSRTERDLKNNVIPLWHDESQINRYLYENPNENVLHPGFCYPAGFEIPFDKKISSVEKREVFDVYKFKNSLVAEGKISFGMRVKIIMQPIIKTVKQYTVGDILYLYHFVRYHNR